MKTSRIFFALFVTFLAFIQVSFAQKNKAENVVKAYYTALDAADVDGFNKIAATNFMLTAPVSPTPFNTESWKMLAMGFKQGFPDMKHEIIDWFADGNKVAVKGIFTGTNTGSMQGNPPSGKKATLPFNALAELDGNGKIASMNVQFDNAAFMKQLMPDMVSTDQIKQNARIAYESLNKRDFATFKTVCAADFTEYSAGPAPIKGMDNVIEAYKMFFAMAPDLKFDITNLTVEGNRVIVESTTTGTNTGMVMGMLPASGKKVKTMDVDIVTFDAQGKATSHSTANPNEFFHQIGYGSLTNPNTGVIMAVYAAFGKGDAAGIAALCDENVVWDCPDNPTKAARRFVGSKNIPTFFGDLMSDVKVTKFQPTRFVADGDDVMVAIDVEWVKNGQTQTMAAPFNHHFKVQNGKIVWFREVVGKISDATMAASSKK